MDSSKTCKDQKTSTEFKQLSKESLAKISLSSYRRRDRINGSYRRRDRINGGIALWPTDGELGSQPLNKY